MIVFAILSFKLKHLLECLTVHKSGNWYCVFANDTYAHNLTKTQVAKADVKPAGRLYATAYWVWPGFTCVFNRWVCTNWFQWMHIMWEIMLWCFSWKNVLFSVKENKVLLSTRLHFVYLTSIIDGLMGNQQQVNSPSYTEDSFVDSIFY